MKDRSQSERGFGLWWALGISIGVHGLLVLISFWLPLRSHSAPPPEEQQAIEFTFAEPEEEEQGRKRGELPVPTPDQARSAPPSDPFPTIPDRTPPPDMPQPEMPAQQPQELPELDPQPEPESKPVETELVDEQQVEEPIDPLEQDPTDEPEGSELEEQQVSPFSSPGRPVTRAAQLPAPAIGIDQALRQFRQQVNTDRPRPEARGTFENVFVPDFADLPLAGSPYAFLEHESKDYDFSDYDRQIYFLILRAWYRRIYETVSEFEKWGFDNQQGHLDHHSKVSFTIQRNGDVTAITLTGPAGCPPLDRSAMDALDEVILPRLPDDFPRDEEVIRATFLARGDIFTLRPHFERLRRMNFF